MFRGEEEEEDDDDVRGLSPAMFLVFDCLRELSSTQLVLCFFFVFCFGAVAVLLVEQGVGRELLYGIAPSSSVGYLPHLR